jgi:hypothetical protein
MGFTSDGLWALTAGSASRWLRHNRTFLRHQRYVSGAVYIGLGLATAASGSRHSPRQRSQSGFQPRALRRRATAVAGTPAGVAPIACRRQSAALNCRAWPRARFVSRSVAAVMCSDLACTALSWDRSGRLAGPGTMLADFPGFADISRNPPDRLPRSALLSQPVAEGGP